MNLSPMSSVRPAVSAPRVTRAADTTSAQKAEGPSAPSRIPRDLAQAVARENARAAMLPSRSVADQARALAVAREAGEGLAPDSMRAQANITPARVLSLLG